MSDSDISSSSGAGQERSVESPARPQGAGGALAQLRGAVAVLGGGLLVVSLALNVFVFKQNRNLTEDTLNRRNQIAQMETMQQRVLPLMNELAKYSLGKPELTAIFARFGIDIAASSATNTTAPFLSKP